jgi:hypothetical protein
VAYGLLHCLNDVGTVTATVRALQLWTAPGGWNVVCSFNDRHQELAEAHPGFQPTLLPHETYVNYYSGWELLFSSDQDLYETHPHNSIPHGHSMTRLIARKPHA